MKDSQRQLEEMSKRMAKLAQEKAELQSRNRILEHVVRLNVDHVEELSCNQVPFLLRTRASQHFNLRSAFRAACVAGSAPQQSHPAGQHEDDCEIQACRQFSGQANGCAHSCT